jgi:hypothetical protein
MTCALDAAFRRAVDDEAVRVIVAFGYHHMVRAHNQARAGDAIGGQDLHSMAAANKPAGGATR